MTWTALKRPFMWLARVIVAGWTALKHHRPRTWLGWVIVAGGVFFALVLLLWWWESSLASPDEIAAAKKSVTASDELNFWIRVIAGKWVPDGVYRPDSFLFSLSAGFALLLNLGLFAGITTLIVGWIRGLLKGENEMIIKLATAWSLSDETVKARIYESETFNALPEEDQTRLEGLIEKAFKDGRKQLVKKLLPQALGRSAREVAQILEKTTLG